PVGLNHARGGFKAETGPANLPLDPQHFDTATDGSRNLLGIGDEIVCNGFLGRKVVRANAWVDIAERKTRKAIMPSRTVRNQRVPPFRAPAFGNPVPLQNQMRHPVCAQMFAHSQPGLSTADYSRVNLFNRHALLHIATPASRFAGSRRPAAGIGHSY